MIKQETVKLNDKVYVRTWSTAGRYIVRDKVEYTEAIDPEDSKREYEEGDPIPLEKDVMWYVTQEALAAWYELSTAQTKGGIKKSDLIKDVLDFYEVKYDD